MCSASVVTEHSMKKCIYDWWNWQSNLFFELDLDKLDGCIVLNKHNTVLDSKRLAICATVYVGV